ncbi:MAG: D-alanine--D-alanine ligase [Coriobacteriales bacterium]|jgi:D-alanine-D-alanine ligase|nr:D-alanine--D-alanine ligase [Coriobacteriales bacterium]
MSYKVAVLMGGSSFERDFSLASGRHVLRTLEAAGHTVLPLDTGATLVETLRHEQPDVAFIALHGKHGEDGTVQSLLEFLSIPFVGSTSSVCRLTWDKSMLPTVVMTYRRTGGTAKAARWPRGICLSATALKDLGAAGALDLVSQRLPSDYPYAVLPSSGGSAMGISKVESADQLASALLEALSFNDEVIIEEWVDGVELAICILGEGENAEALPPIEISSQTGFFNTEARIDPEFVEYYIPVRNESLAADADPAVVNQARVQIAAAALEVHKAFGCRDLSRVDMIWDVAQQAPKVLEINVVPGMSEFSLLPAALEASGIGFGTILNQLLDKAVARGK